MRVDALITHGLELFAAIAGFYYLSKNKDSKLRPLVYFLVLTVFIEAIGTYTTYYKLFDVLKPIENTVFKDSYWLYNLFVIINAFFFLNLYRNILTKDKHRKFLKFFMLVSVFAVAIIIFCNNIFEGLIEALFLWTTLCVFLSVLLYFYEMLISKNIINLLRYPIFIVSIGILIWWLVYPLILFYMDYYKTNFPEFLKFKSIILIILNVIMYGCFIVGFLWGKEE